MPVPLHDAHNHLAHPSLSEVLSNFLSTTGIVGIKHSIVNATHTEEWAAVLEFCAAYPNALPAIGLHPWYVDDAPADWQSRFVKAFDNDAQVVGEIGLDRSNARPNLDKQMPAFEFQLEFAAQNNLPVSIHAVNATGALLDSLRSKNLPARGFHLHAYAGPLELVDELVALGSHFSFNSSQLQHPKVAETIIAIPGDRLFLETDAPFRLPPAALQEFSFEAPFKHLNHPANLKQTYQAVANIRKLDVVNLAQRIDANFRRFFLTQSD